MLLSNFEIRQYLNFIYLFKYFDDVKFNINLMIFIRCYYKISTLLDFLFKEQLFLFLSCLLIYLFDIIHQ